MKISFTFFIFIASICFFFACSSEEDPLPSSTSENPDSLMSKYWDLYDRNLSSNLDSALFYIEKVKTLAEASKKTEWIAGSYWAIGYIKKEQGYFGEGSLNFLKAAQIFKDAGEVKSLADIYTGLGEIYAKAQDFETAISFYSQAKDIFEYEGSESNKAKVYRNLANCYKELEKYDDADNVLTSGKEHAIKAHDYLILSNLYNTWGIVKLQQKDYKKARDYYQLAYQCADSLKENPRLVAAPYNNIGEAYLFEGNYQLAEKWLNQALEIKKKIGDPTFTQSTLNNLGRLRIEQEQYDSAIEILEQGLSNVSSVTVDPAVEEGLALMMEALVKTNAKGTPAQYAHLNRQLATYSQKLMAYNTRLSDLKQQLETTSKQQALQLAFEKHTLGNQLEAAEEKNKQIQYAFIIPVLLLIAASISIYLAIRRNRNAKQLINAIDDVLNKRHQNIAR